jgi:DNA processing protein
MILNKEQLLTLTCLKDVGVKGVGPKKIFSIAKVIEDKSLNIKSYEELADLMANMPEKVIRQVTLEDLNDAFLCAQRIIKASESSDVGYVGYYDDDFPELLRHSINEEGKLDPPLILWYRGDLSITKLPGLAIIGTREATQEGIVGGEYLSGELAKRGFNIISGLAIGCDTSGHRGALNVGGKTTAILANGLDNDSIYPTENKSLAEEIVKKGGLLLSEYRIGSSVNKYSLVARDRLQAGLSVATFVVQTGEKGGTMHAAKTTLIANKPLYTLYFKDENTRQHEKCLGNALLVKQGAKYISGKDNLDEICVFIKNFEPTI